MTTYTAGTYDGAIDQFRNRVTQPNTQGNTQSTNGFNTNVVKELIGRGYEDLAREHYPVEYAALHGGPTTTPTTTPTAGQWSNGNQQLSPTQGQVKVYNRKTNEWGSVPVDATLADAYNTQNWGTQMRFDPTALQQDPTEQDSAYGDKLSRLVDYSQLGSVNGSSKNLNAYKMFDKGALLPSLFVRKYGLAPEEVLALNPYDRKEAAERLLTEYYQKSPPAYQQQIGDVNAWIRNTLSHYGLDDRGIDKDSASTAAFNLAKGVGRGVVDQFSNYYQGAKTALGFGEMTEEQQAAAKADQEYRAKNRTKSETALLQRFDSLIEDGRYVDAAEFVVANPDVYGALAGSTVGALVTDALVTTGLLAAGGAAVGSLAPVAGTAAGAAAGATAGAARAVATLAPKLAQLAKAGTYVGVSGLGMSGSVAKELMMDGNTIPVGSDLYNQLAAYGVIGSAISMLPGTMENQLLRKILSSPAGKNLSEAEAGSLVQKTIASLQSKGYRFTEQGVTRPRLRGATEWGGKAAFGVVGEGGTEALQEGYESALKQAAGKNGEVDWDKVDPDQVRKDAGAGLVLGGLLGGATSTASAAHGYAKRGDELKAAHDAWTQANAPEIQDTVDPQDTAQPVDTDTAPDVEQQQASADEFSAGTDASDSEFRRVSAQEADLALAKDLNESGYEYLPARRSPVKDIRQLFTPEGKGDTGHKADKLWADTRKGVESWVSKVDKDISRLQDRLDSKALELDPALPQAVLAVREAERNDLSQQVAGLTATRDRVEAQLHDVDDAGQVLSLIDFANANNILSGKAKVSADQLRTAANYALSTGIAQRNPQAVDGATRFSSGERQQVIKHITDALTLAGVTDANPQSLVSDDLQSSLQSAKDAVTQSRYNRTARAARALYKLEALRKAVVHNRPELLDAYGQTNNKLSKITGVLPEAYNDKAKLNILNAQQRFLSDALGTARFKKAGGSKGLVFDDQTQKSVDELITDFKYHPKEVAEDLKRVVSDYRRSQIQTNDQASLEQQSSLLGLESQIAELVSDLSGNNVFMHRTAGNSATLASIAVNDNKIYDPVVADLPWSEVNRYAKDVNDIANVFGLKGVAPAFERNMRANVANLREKLKANPVLKLKPTAKNDFVVTSLLGKGMQSHEATLTNTIDHYLHDIEARLLDVETRMASGGNTQLTTTPVDLNDTSKYPDGSLVYAVIEEHKNGESRAIRDWLKNRKAVVEDALDPPANEVVAEMDTLIDDLVGQDPLNQPPTPPVGSKKLVNDFLSRATNDVSNTGNESTADAESKVLGDGIWKVLVGDGGMVSFGNQVVPTRQAIDTIYAKAVATQGGGDVSPVAVSDMVRQAFYHIQSTNPDRLSPTTISILADKISNIAAVDRWLKGADTKQRSSVMRELAFDVSNDVVKARLSEVGAVPVSDLIEFVAKMATWYADNGYTHAAGLLRVITRGVDPTVMSRKTRKDGRNYVSETNTVAGNTHVEMLPKDSFVERFGDNYGVYTYKDGRSVIYLREDDMDIAKTLAHELGHVAWADLLLKKDVWDLNQVLSDKERAKGVARLNRELSSDELAHLADMNVLEVDDTATVDTPNTVYKFKGHGVEELLMGGVDTSYSATPDATPVGKAIKAVFGPSVHTVDDALGKVMGKLLGQTRGPSKRKLRAGALEHSPLYHGFEKEVVKKRAKVNQFYKSPNPDNQKDTTTVYHFGFHEDNQNVSSNPMAWWDGNSWTFYYIDASGEANRTVGLSASDVLQLAQDLNLYIDQREKDVILTSEPAVSDKFSQFSPGMAKFWRGLNRMLGGTDEKVNPMVRGIMSAAQSWAVEQMGADHFYTFFENALSSVEGTPQHGKMQTIINRIRTKTNYQLHNNGVGGDVTLHELRGELEKYLRGLGWSRNKVDDVLYAMRAKDYYFNIYNRQKDDPKWRGKPFDATKNLSGFSFVSEDGKTVSDPTGELYMATLSPQDLKVAEELKTLVTKLNDLVLQVEYESGRISEEQYNDQYGKYYVPLRNESDEATAFQRQAVGRHTKAASPLVYLQANHQARLKAAEQSMIYQAFMDLMEQHPIKGFATFNSSTLKNKGDGSYALSADGFIEGNNVTFFRDGKKVTMTITHPEMAAALKKRKGEAASAYLNVITKATGMMGLTRTGLPTFAKTAFLRDLGMAFFNVQAAFRGQEKLNSLEWLALGSKTARDMFRYAPIIAKSRWSPDNADWRYNVYRSEGGIGNVTGYDIESVDAALERDIFDAGSLKNKAKKGARRYLDLLHTSDDAARFALWMNYLEKKNGAPFKSEQEMLTFLKSNPSVADIARNASKNITGNFEQRGMSRRLRAHFIFWQAIQAGMKNVYGLLNPRYGTYGIKSVGALMAYVMMSGSDEEDDDGKSKASRMKGLGNNITIGDYQVNVAQELRPMTHLAEAIKFYVNGDWDMSQAVNHIGSGISQAVIPFQGAQTGDALVDLTYAITPTVIQPVVLQTAGLNYFGGENAPTPYDNQGRKWTNAPDAYRASSSASGVSKDIAQAMYHFTGGTVDVAPGSLDMWQMQLFGSAYSHARDIAKRVEQGENLLEAGFNQFTKQHERAYNTYALKDEVTSRFDKALREHRIGDDNVILGKDEWSDDYQELYDLQSEMKKELDSLTGPNSDAKMTDLINELSRLKHSDSPSPDEFLRLTNEIELLSQSRNAVYGKYNRMLLDMGY